MFRGYGVYIREITMNIGVYVRKSVYSDKSDSTEAQNKICKEYAHNNYKATTVITYEDEGFSGANTDRPGFNRLMKDITNKRLDVLICYKIDRLSRNVLDFSKTFDILQQNNVEFVSVKEQIDTSTPLGRAMMYICSVFAQMERETIAERVKDGMIELAKSGKWAGGKAPIGFSLNKIFLNGKKHTILIENEEEVPFLNMIYDTFLEGVSLSGLETYFRKKSIKSINGHYLSASQLYSILKNPHYAAATPEIYDYFNNRGCIMAVEKNKFDGQNGVMAYGRTTGGKRKKHTVNTSDKWIISIGIHKPIMSAEKWLAVQERFGKNVIDKSRKHEIGILKGTLRCKCGYSMRVQHKVDKYYNKVYDNYYCQNRNRRGVAYCDMKMVSVKKLDDAMLELLGVLSVNKDMIARLIKKNTPDQSVPIRSSSLITKEINTIEKKIGNLTIALQDCQGSSAAKYIISEIEKLDKQIISLNYELRELNMTEQENKKNMATINEIQDRIVNYLKSFDSLGYKDKAKFIEDLFSECTWNGKELFLLI
jgi:DNA invertase Pin-like site-specific DNA recombinase